MSWRFPLGRTAPAGEDRRGETSRLAAGAGATFGVLLDASRAFLADDPFRLAAAVSYYTLLSMAPLLLIVVAVGSLVFSEAVVREELLTQIRSLVGTQGAEVVRTVIENSQGPGRGVVSLMVGGGLMLLGATTVFAQLQSGLNHVWHVEADPRNAVLGFLRQRLLSFALVLVIGFLLMVSLVVSALMAGLESYFGTLELASLILWQMLNTVVTFALFNVLVAMIFKYLPDVVIAWRDVWLGAFITTVLFVTGKHAIGLYLGQATIASVFGAAGSVVVFMFWIYAVALIFFFGAEITQAVARRRGARVEASRHGRKVAR